MDKQNVAYPYIHVTLFSNKKNEVLTHGTTCINLKNIMLCERSQSQKTTDGMISYISNVQNRQIYEQKVA